MKKILFLALVCCLLTACGKKAPHKERTESISSQQNLPGDSTIYGLACDGCTDSILILLPYTGGDLDTFDIIKTFQRHHIYGRPNIGDKMAVILDNDSTKEARMVINISTLQGQWAYMVEPQLRHHSTSMPPLPDSIRQRIMVPREYGFRLKNGDMAHSFGYSLRDNDKMSPVEYPSMKRYAHWQLFNGRLILIPDTMTHQSPDTASIVLLRRDSLQLRFSDRTQAYYRKR